MTPGHALALGDAIAARLGLHRSNRARGTWSGIATTTLIDQVTDEAHMRETPHGWRTHIGPAALHLAANPNTAQTTLALIPVMWAHPRQETP